MNSLKKMRVTTFLLFVTLASCQKIIAMNHVVPLITADLDLKSDSTDLTAQHIIPFVNNSFVTKITTPEDVYAINDEGLVNWTNPRSVISTYFRLGTTGNLTLKIKGKVVSGNSKIKVTVKNRSFDMMLSGTTQSEYLVGTIPIDEIGYVKVDFQGLSKTGHTFADVSHLIISGSATTKDVVFGAALDRGGIHYNRRGVAVTLAYVTPPKTEWFYNEVKVEPGDDPINSFYMSNGFENGYFGMQVRGEDRTFQYSLWDHNNEKPILLEKHKDVIHSGFDHEGSGGATTLIYPWKSGTTYKFLTRGILDGQGGTLFSSWVFLPERDSWEFIATFRLPGFDRGLKGLHSFIENFGEDEGHMFRRAIYANQWARDASGTWSELTNAHALGGQTVRKDNASGVTKNGDFYAQISGFFSEHVPDRRHARPKRGIEPKIDLEKLPNANVDRYISN